MTNSPAQRLRFIINEYWKFVKIDDLYTKLKKYVYNIEHWNEFPPEKSERLFNTYKFWLEWLEIWEIDPHSERLRLLDKLNEWKVKFYPPNWKIEKL